MSEAIVKASDYTPGQLDLIKTQICKGASDAQLGLFVATCERLGLDPFARQVFAVMRKDKELGTVMTIQVSIDGFRAVADASGDYQGQTAAQWCGDDGVWRDVWLSQDFPAAARVGVWRSGFREPLYAVATWLSYVQTNYEGKPSSMWSKMPDLMLAKCAESLALRKAFPRKLSGLYTPDEMAQSVVVEEVKASIGGSMVSVALPSGQTYDDKANADEKSRVTAEADVYFRAVAPNLEEQVARAVQEMLECAEVATQDAAAGEREAEEVTANHRAQIAAWCSANRKRITELRAHPAAEGAVKKVWNRLLKWGTAAKIDPEDLKAMLWSPAQTEAT